MIRNLFKKITAGALALMMLAAAVPAGSDFTGVFSSAVMTASAEPEGQYQLVYSAGDGSGTMKSETYGDNDSYKFPICTFTAPEGKVFSYWEMSGADGIYYPGSEIKIASNCAMDGVITVTACWTDNQCGRNAYWDFDYVTGTLTISGTGTMYDYEVFGAPWFSLNEKFKRLVVKDGITRLGNYAFSYCKDLSEAEIPDSVIYFGSDVFQASGLESIDLSNTELIGIAPYTFSDCNSLTSVKLPKALKTIFAGAFTDCENLVSVHLPEGLTEIQYYAFDSCSALNSINIPASVTKIGYNAFIDCKKLSDIYCCAKSTIDWDTDDTSNNFKPNKGTVCHVYKSELAGFEAKGLNLTFIGDLNCGDNAYWDFDEETGTLTITGTGEMFDYVYSINDRTCDTPWFSFRDKIKHLDISSGITRIGNNAFRECENLTEINIPSTVESIGPAAFCNCYEVASVTFAKGSKLKTLADYSLDALFRVEELTLPEGLESIGSIALGNLRRVKKITIPSTVTNIHWRAFAGTTDEIDELYISADPSKLDWETDTSCFKKDKATICHVPAKYIGGYREKFGEQNLTFIADCEVKVKSVTGGKVTASKTIANKDDEITLNVKPSTGYKLKSLTVKDASGNTMSVNNNKFTMPESDVTVTPEFEKEKYTVTFYDEDGKTVLKSEKVEYGELPTAPAEPTKKATAKNTYKFAGWTPEIVKVTGEASYKATYKATVRKYNVTFYDEDGKTVLKTGQVKYGELPTAPAEPTKKATAKNTYKFAGWTPEIVKVTGEASYKATYKATVRKYTVTFYDEDGKTVLKTGQVKYGELPTAPAEPTKKATAKNTYKFAGWTPEIVKVTGAASYKATYKATVNKYTVTFYDEDGKTVLKSEKVEYGKLPTAPAEPTKKATAQYTYKFAGWTPEIVKVTGAASYKATYKATVRKYTVTFYDEDGKTVLKTGQVKYGELPTAPAEPTKKATAKNTYKFAGWTPEIVKVTGAASYKATYTATVRKYTVTFYDEDGKTVLKTEQVKYGELPTAPADPTKKATAQYTYKFAGWTPEIVKVTGAASYKATYTATVNKYTVKFVNEDGKVLQKSDVAYGEMPKYTGATPAKAKTELFEFVFKGWDKKLEKVTKAAQYKAVYEAKRIGLETTRLAGRNRFLTAVEISKASYKTADTVVLAYGLNYADALAGVPLAYKLDAPILLTYTDTLDSATLAEIVRLKAKKAVILGGTGAINEDVEAELKRNGLETERIAGKSRFGTATAAAQKLNAAPEEIFFVYGMNYADALSVSAAAALKKAPIIYLSTSGELNADTAEYLAKLKKKGCVKNAYIIGGEGVISNEMADKATKALGLSKAKRIAGQNRFLTCVEINRTFADILTGKAVCAATGTNYPDALAGGVFAAKQKAPLFLAAGKLSDEQIEYLKTKAAEGLYVFGGTGAVPDELVDAIKKASIYGTR